MSNADNNSFMLVATNGMIKIQFNAQDPKQPAAIHFLDNNHDTHVFSADGQYMTTLNGGGQDEPVLDDNDVTEYARNVMLDYMNNTMLENSRNSLGEPKRSAFNNAATAFGLNQRLV